MDTLDSRRLSPERLSWMPSEEVSQRRAVSAKLCLVENGNAEHCCSDGGEGHQQDERSLTPSVRSHSRPYSVPVQSTNTGA